jgi:hypothetical protein
MDRALYWGWKEGSQLVQYLIQPLHEHLEQVHTQARAPSLHHRRHRRHRRRHLPQCVERTPVLTAGGQVVMMLDELVRRIRHFDARMSHFSTTLGIHLAAGPAGAGAGAGEEAPAASSSSSTPLRMSLTVQHLEREMKKTLNRLVRRVRCVVCAVCAVCAVCDVNS